jgi:Arc/MetJ-type ribon-helix-helix transcriptional regulator
MNLTRSDVIRVAIRQMLEEMRGAAEEAAEEEELEHIVAV